MAASRGCKVFLAQGVMLRLSARRLPQQVGRGGAIAPGCGTSFRPEVRKVAKCGNHLATGERGRSATRLVTAAIWRSARPIGAPRGTREPRSECTFSPAQDRAARCVCVCAMRAVFGEPPLPPAASKPVAATLRANVPLGNGQNYYYSVMVPRARNLSLIHI